MGTRRPSHAAMLDHPIAPTSQEHAPNLRFSSKSGWAFHDTSHHHIHHNTHATPELPKTYSLHARKSFISVNPFCTTPPLEAYAQPHPWAARAPTVNLLLLLYLCEREGVRLGDACCDGGNYERRNVWNILSSLGGLRVRHRSWYRRCSFPNRFTFGWNDSITRWKKYNIFVINVKCVIKII